jgi:hypothetical protein
LHPLFFHHSHPSCRCATHNHHSRHPHPSFTSIIHIHHSHPSFTSIIRVHICIHCSIIHIHRADPSLTTIICVHLLLHCSYPSFAAVVPIYRSFTSTVYMHHSRSHSSLTSSGHTSSIPSTLHTLPAPIAHIHHSHPVVASSFTHIAHNPSFTPIVIFHHSHPLFVSPFLSPFSHILPIQHSIFGHASITSTRHTSVQCHQQPQLISLAISACQRNATRDNENPHEQLYVLLETQQSSRPSLKDKAKYVDILCVYYE